MYMTYVFLREYFFFLTPARINQPSLSHSYWHEPCFKSVFYINPLMTNNSIEHVEEKPHKTVSLQGGNTTFAVDVATHEKISLIFLILHIQALFMYYSYSCL